MQQRGKKSKLTLEKVARMTQGEFLVIRKDMAKLATKDDLRNFATREDLRELGQGITEEVRRENQKVIQSNDKVVTRLDTLVKEQAAHKMAHDRIGEDLEDHEKRIKRVEAAVR